MDTNADGQTTYGMNICLDRELKVWDDLLNLHYGEVMAQARANDADMDAAGSSAPSQAEALRDMQRRWIAFRDAKCAYERSLWGGGTGGGTATLWCLLYETADQALYLEAERE